MAKAIIFQKKNPLVNCHQRIIKSFTHAHTQTHTHTVMTPSKCIKISLKIRSVHFDKYKKKCIKVR